MKKEIVKAIFDRKNEVERKGRGVVEVKVYISRSECKFIRLDYITADEWPYYQHSDEVKAVIAKCERVLYLMKELGIKITKDSFNDFYESDEIKAKKEERKQAKEAKCKITQPYSSHRNSFLDFFFDELGHEKIAPRTRQARMVVYNTLLRFDRIHTFDDLTPAHILELHKFIQGEAPRTATTLKHYHKRLHRYVLKAFEYGYIERDPYKQVTIPTGQYKERKPLTETELDLLLSLHLPPKEAKARDLFIFSAYTGLSYCDAQALDFHTMAEKHGDLWYIDGSRIKSGTTFYTPILPRAFAVLEKYNFRLPRMSNQKLNDYLHLVESRASLHKNLTSHLARHTFATMVLAQDVPVEDLARMLGHKDVRTTQHYAKILKTTIHRHAEDLIRKLRK